MKKLLSFLTIFAFFAIALAPLNASAAPASVNLTIHYQRPAGDYVGWNMWLWKNHDGAGSDVSISETGVPFNGEDAFGKVLTINIPEMSDFDNVGFIVRLNSWEKKDVEQDRFIKDFDANGNAEIWLIQGDSAIYTSAPVIKATMSSVRLTGFRTMVVSMNSKIKIVAGDNGFKVSGDSQIESVKGLNGDESGSTLIELTLSEDINLDNSYFVTHPDYGKQPVSISGLYDSPQFADKYTYTGNDLGNTYSSAATKFRVWAPTATDVSLVTYPSATAPESGATKLPMSKAENGTWVTSLSGDHNGLIYMYQVTVNGSTNEAVDPYVRATTANGVRGVVVDLSKTNPVGWSTKKPKFSGNPTDAVIYEIHVRDLSTDSSANYPAAQRGKFLAFTNNAVKTKFGGKAGISAIKELGVTHIQLQPVFDFASVDELNPSFNWGYDPQNYNVPEGSYSSNPSKPTSRITELKSAIQSMHNLGLRVNMDVVYNHVYDAARFSEEKIVPGYFFRTNADGSLTNGSGCGNDTASERSMVSKFIVDSVKFWSNEYHFDGFRFDLMGLHDIKTMREVRLELSKIDPTILVIGEGWNMGTLPADQRATQVNIEQLQGVGVFNDQIRDAVKGSVFNSAEAGYATGRTATIDSVKIGIVGNINYPTLFGNWTAGSPGQSVNYVEAHDNNTLYDKILLSTPRSNPAVIANLDRFAASIPILAQGLPFIASGQEFLRSKQGDSNSYQSSDEINNLKWNLRSQNIQTVNYYSGLIALRKAHPAFRMPDSKSVKTNVKFLNAPANVIEYSLDGNAVKDSWSKIVVVHNPNAAATKVNLPSVAKWSVVVEGAKAGTTPIRVFSGASVSVPPHSTLVVAQTKSK